MTKQEIIERGRLAHSLRESHAYQTIKDAIQREVFEQFKNTSQMKSEQVADLHLQAQSIGLLDKFINKYIDLAVHEQASDEDEAY
ncbi:hypothetical protein FY134_03100 [Agrobacterium fabrum]|uniref:hypothetical protein n=1 Tax=Agrobacterium fabrum TaxID=1176649 RepID=UPI0021CE9753|nr:hypothetical protein [Agrobacterium fabrum]UXT56686.1 hypothetical protein FY134_03100 [Agrobacterium fabrum]